MKKTALNVFIALLSTILLSSAIAHAKDFQAYSQSVLGALDQYEETPTSESLGAAKFQVEMLIIDYSIKLSELKIQYDVVASPSAVGDYHWDMFVIKPEGKHPLNVLAGSLKRKIGARVAYDPIRLLRSQGMSAAFLSDTNILLLSHEAVSTGKVGLNEGHEIIHAHFFAQQNGRISFIPKAPVFIEMFAAPGLFSGIDIYTTYLSFEELVAYAYNIKGDAGQDSDLAIKKDLVEGRIIQMLQISERALEAIDKAMDLYVDGKFGVEERGGQSNLVFRDNFFALAVVLPREMESKPQLVAYKQLQAAKALAEFNIKYFKGYKKMSTKVLMEKSRKFKSAQQKFIENF